LDFLLLAAYSAVVALTQPTQFPTMDGGGCFPTGRHYPGIAHLIKVAAIGVAEEWASDVAMNALPLVCIDTETTGRDPAVDRIIEVGCVFFEAGEVRRRVNWLINPECPIPQEATDVHGIKDEQVADCPTFPEVAQQVLDALQRAVPVAYNAQFDRDFLLTEFSRASLPAKELPPALRKGVEWLDPLVWARELQKEERSKALGEVCERLGIALEKAHRATNDAEAAVRVMAAFAGDIRVPKTYAAFLQEQRRLARIFEEERVRWRVSG
jgi:DNA polymerase-3 subunit epsilon